MSIFNKKPEEQKSLTEKLVDKKGTVKKYAISEEELIVKRRANKRHIKNKIAQLTKKGRNTDVIKIGKQNKNKKKRVKAGLNLNRESPERGMRDKIRDDRRNEKGLKPIK